MEPVDLARLAAFIDGEGTIHISKRHRGKHIRYSVQLSVTNTDPRLIHWLKGKFGGFITYQPSRSLNRKSSFKWEVGQAAAEKILSSCLGYFLLKRERAELALAFRATFRKAQQERVASAVMDEREEIRGRMMILNSRGCATSSSATKVA